MKLLQYKNYLKFFTDLKFAIFILGLIALISSIGSIIEQDESIEFYQTNYPLTQPIYGFIDWKLIRALGFDHLYTTWWFFSLLALLSISLISCTISRQFPIFKNAKEFFFKTKKHHF